MALAQQTTTETQENGAPLLHVAGISKTFSGIKVLKDVSLSAYGGEILALMGENGAGKSTLMKILSGAYIADPGGEIRIAGEIAKITNPASARLWGLASSIRSWRSRQPDRGREYSSRLRAAQRRHD